MPSYPLTFPSSPLLLRASIALAHATTVARSPFTGKEQRGEQPYAIWVAQGVLPSLDGSDPNEAAAWRAFVVELRGMYGTFNFPVPGVSGPLTGYAGAAGLVNGANQTGTSLVTDGWTASASLFKRGDYFTVNNELKMVMSNLSANGSGQATITFEPALRSSPADNAALTIVNPFCVMRMNQDDLGWDISSPLLHDLQLKMVEAV